MQQTADVEILWITVDVAAECLPAYGSFFSSAAVADGDAMATDVDVEMTAACGSSYYSSAVADLEMAAVMDADVDAAVATTAASSHLSKQLRRLFYKVKMREIRLNLPRSIFLLSHI